MSPGESFETSLKRTTSARKFFLYLSERSQHFDAQKGSGASWIIQVTYHRAIDRRR
jgi:hypothetical protein